MAARSQSNSSRTPWPDFLPVVRLTAGARGGPESPVKSRKRRSAYLRGLRAEWLAVLALRLKGYRILAQRYNAPGGEIDIVAARRDTIAFVEVKHRRALDEARMAITVQKRQRIARAARHWLARHPAAFRKTLRGDAVFLAPGRWPRHEENLFELDL
ncbi:MAG: YraN family protein [Beijerinckiaceae bacterium]